MRVRVLALIIIANGLLSTNLYSQTRIEDYVEFLKEQKNPKEYIFQLWKDADIIVLGERDHRDTTQYNLILDILSDERFIENVGNLYLEVGVVNATEKANSLIKSNYSKEIFDKEFVELQMVEVWSSSYWDKYNRYQLLYGLSKINRELSKDKQIDIGLIDMEFSWYDDITPEKYLEFNTVEMNKEFNTREKIMADNFLAFYSKQHPRNNHKKALIITSREYAGNFYVQCRGNDVKRQAGYIKDVYGDRVKTVALNWYKWIPLDWHRQILPDKTNGLSADGKFDASFELTNCNPVGFDLENSPFGEDEYDYTFENNLKWKDVFDGFIFYEPYYNFIGKAGFPTKLTNKQAKEFTRRMIIDNKAFGNSKNARLLQWFGWIYKYIDKKEYGNLREFECITMYPNYSEWESDMNRWIKDR